jgi:hypothetical protein
MMSGGGLAADTRAVSVPSLKSIVLPFAGFATVYVVIRHRAGVIDILSCQNRTDRGGSAELFMRYRLHVSLLGTTS